MHEWNEVLMYVGGPMLAGVALFFLKGVRTWAIKLWKGHKAYPEKKHFVMNQNIQTLLTEIRAIAHADRTGAYQFHNGAVFSNSNPIWRISCTHETCSTGTSSQMINRQNILSSSITDLLTPLFSSDERIPIKGMTIIDNGSKRYLLYITHDMLDSFWRVILILGGSERVYVIPLIHNKILMGFITVCYRTQNLMSPEQFAIVDDKVTQIVYELTKG